jgi:hypothetical protein
MTMAHEDNTAPVNDCTQDSGEATNFLEHLGDAVSQNPVAAAMIGMGALWLLMGGSRISLVGTTIGPEHNASAPSINTARAAESAGIAGRKIGEGASAAASHASDAISSVYDSVSAATSKAADLASRSGSSASGMVREARHDISALHERQPLLLGAVGLALGAGIAAALPSTAIERRLVGKTSETVRTQAGTVVSQGLESAKTAAADAMDEMKS